MEAFSNRIQTTSSNHITLSLMPCQICSPMSKTGFKMPKISIFFGKFISCISLETFSDSLEFHIIAYKLYRIAALFGYYVFMEYEGIRNVVIRLFCVERSASLSRPFVLRVVVKGSNKCTIIVDVIPSTTIAGKKKNVSEKLPIKNNGALEVSANQQQKRQKRISNALFSWLTGRGKAIA